MQCVSIVDVFAGPVAAPWPAQVDYTKFALFFNHTEPNWLAEVEGGVQWQLDQYGPHPNHPTDAHWCAQAASPRPTPFSWQGALGTGRPVGRP